LPNEIGVDRLVDSYASSLEADKVALTSALVIDFGTATTFNFSNKVKNDWFYEGGVIFPGINLSLDSLKNATAKLPRVSFQKCDNILAKNTTDAINSGMFFGYRAMVSGVIEQFKTINANIYVVATGGLAGLICSDIKSINSIQKDLTLQTILQIAKLL
jgi:type III pantothenate kinase